MSQAVTTVVQNYDMALQLMLNWLIDLGAKFSFFLWNLFVEHKDNTKFYQKITATIGFMIYKKKILVARHCLTKSQSDFYCSEQQ